MLHLSLHLNSIFPVPPRHTNQNGNKITRRRFVYHHLSRVKNAGGGGGMLSPVVSPTHTHIRTRSSITHQPPDPSFSSTMETLNKNWRSYVRDKIRQTISPHHSCSPVWRKVLTLRHDLWCRSSTLNEIVNVFLNLTRLDHIKVEKWYTRHIFNRLSSITHTQSMNRVGERWGPFPPHRQKILQIYNFPPFFLLTSW